MMLHVPQNSTSQNIPLILRSTNAPYGPDVAATLNVQIRKPGGSWAATAGAIVSVGNGFYELVANASDRDTPGLVYVAVTSSSDANVFLPDTVYFVDAPPVPVTPTPPVIQQTINGGLSAGDSQNLANVAAYLKLLVNATVPAKDQIQ